MMVVYISGGCQTQGCLMFRMCTKDFSDFGIMQMYVFKKKSDHLIQVALMLVNLLLHQIPEVDNTCFHFSSVSVFVRFFFSSTFSLFRAVWVQKVKLKCDYWNENKKDTEMPPCRRVQEPFMHQFTQAKPLACINCTC